MSGRFDPGDRRVLLAGYGLAGRLALDALLTLGFAPAQIAVLGHEDDGDAGLVVHAGRIGVLACTAMARSPTVQAFAESHRPAALFSVYYREILPAAVLGVPDAGAVNLHPSLLPRHRGAFSAPWAILDGDAETGVTFHEMVAEVDAGWILLQERLAIRPDETAYGLYHRLLWLGLSRFPRVVAGLLDGTLTPRPQQGEASYHPRALPHGGVVDPSWDDDYTARFLRAMYFPPLPGAIVLRGGVRHEVHSLAEVRALRGEGGG